MKEIATTRKLRRKPGPKGASGLTSEVQATFRYLYDPWSLERVAPSLLRLPAVDVYAAFFKKSAFGNILALQALLLQKLADVADCDQETTLGKFAGHLIAGRTAADAARLMGCRPETLSRLKPELGKIILKAIQEPRKAGRREHHDKSSYGRNPPYAPS